MILIAICSTTILSAAEPGRPNIVLLLADDLGWTGLRCFGSDLYETPNLDRLAAEGMRFTDAYSACTVCSPSRAAIMTGKYPARLRLTDFISGQNRPFAKLRIPKWTPYLRREETTLPEALHQLGYKTAHVGKWHLSPRGSRDDKAYQPVGHGFDRQVLKPASAKGYFLQDDDLSSADAEGEYLTDYLTDRAVEILEDWKAQPFLLYLAYHVPHTPIQGKKKLVDYYAGKVKPDAKHQNPTYAAMVHSLDEGVGRIVDQLNALNIAENTLLLFTSDNGGLTQRYGKLDGFTDNHPLRRGKGSAYEGGVRVPMIVKWPSVTPAGSVCSQPLLGIDFMPTLLEVAGRPTDQSGSSAIDGLSLVPLLRDPRAPFDREAIFWHYPHYHAGGDGPYSAIRAGKWRLIQFYESSSLALYDLANDPGERSNLVDRRPEVVQVLSEKLNQWRAQVNAQTPTLNPDYDPDRAQEVGPTPSFLLRPR